MIAAAFKELLIERVIAVIRGHERELEPEQVEGCLAGLELCRQLDRPEDFERTMRRRIRREAIMFYEDVPQDEYLWHCAGTIVMEYLWERLEIVWGLPGPYTTPALEDFAELMEFMTDPASQSALPRAEAPPPNYPNLGELLRTDFAGRRPRVSR